MTTLTRERTGARSISIIECDPTLLDLCVGGVVHRNGRLECGVAERGEIDHGYRVTHGI